MQARYLAGPDINVIFEHAFPQVQLQQMLMYNQMPVPVEHSMHNMAF